jgi:hypothetical protein
MSFIHYLYLGHFEHDGDVVRFSKGPTDSAYRPVVRRPIEAEEVEAILREVKGVEGDHPTFPDEWTIWPEHGYFICNKYAMDREEIDFVTRLVERTGCDIHDFAAHCDLTLREWLDVTQCHAKL